MMRKGWIGLCLCFFCFICIKFGFAQVVDTQVAMEQLNKINIAKENIAKIQKQITKEDEIANWFGKIHASFSLKEPITKDDSRAFSEFLNQFIPVELNPQSCRLPGIEEKVLVYIFPRIFENPVSCKSGKGECAKVENLVIVVTVSKKTGIVEDFAQFDFDFEQELKR